MPSILVSLASAALLACAQAVTLKVGTTGGNASSPNLYGIMFEDINHSGDGGIHGQLLQNNGFQGDNPGLNAWTAVGGANISQDMSSPLSSQLPSTLKIAVPAGARGPVGVANQGYLGVPVNQDTYWTSFWYKGSFTGDLTIALVGNSSGNVYASSNVSVTGGSTFTQYNTTMQSQQSPDGNNVWQVTFKPSSTGNNTVNIGLPQLFPSTYKGRVNGLRNDVASFLDNIKPSFLRFPGGNNLEGSSPSNRWQWNLTVGPLPNRPGRQGTWGYPNTDALGLLEYLQWCEDMNMAPVLAVWSGLSFDNGSVVEGDALQPYVDDTLNELEFLMGNSSTQWGGYRAQLGRSEPYNISMIEVGNEDNLAGGCASYPSRFTAFHDAITKSYPSLQIIASTTDSTCLPSPLPSNVWTDIHHYEQPDQFVASFNEFDNYARAPGYGVFVGEYACTNFNNGSQTTWQFMQASCAEAVYMIGLERNSDLVKMASYAPLIEHFDMEQWSPDLYGFDSSPGSLTGSTSYYVQQIFSTSRGATIMPVQADAGFGPVYWVASQSADKKSYVVKLANYATNATTVTVQIPDAQGLSGAASLQLVSGPANSTNQPHAVSITAQTSSVNGSATGGYTVNMPAYGVGVLNIGS